jgi:hypothetical protein
MDCQTKETDMFEIGLKPLNQKPSTQSLIYETFLWQPENKF